MHGEAGAKHIARGMAASANTFGIDQVIGTAFLVAFVFAVTDAYNAPVKASLAPLAVGLVVVAIGMSFGANAGYAINPARDLGPRLLAGIEGWGSVALPGDTATSTATCGSRSWARW